MCPEGIRKSRESSTVPVWVSTVYREVEEKRRKQKFKMKGDLHFTDDGRRAESTVDLVLQARAKMSENKVNGPEDAVVIEMI